MMRLLRATLSVGAFGLLAAVASASPITLTFAADGFQNAGTSYPGLNGAVSGSISWDAASVIDSITALTDIDLTIQGHSYSLAEVGIANNGATQTAFGALARGANAVVGDGAFHDFLIVFDRLQPSISAFAYSVEGKTGAIWWTPTVTSATYELTNEVPEPSSVMLVATGLIGLVVRRRRRSGRAAA